MLTIDFYCFGNKSYFDLARKYHIATLDINNVWEKNKLLKEYFKTKLNYYKK